jgi:hypothetical protein
MPTLKPNQLMPRIETTLLFREFMRLLPSMVKGGGGVPLGGIAAVQETACTCTRSAPVFQKLVSVVHAGTSDMRACISCAELSEPAHFVW